MGASWASHFLDVYLWSCPVLDSKDPENDSALWRPERSWANVLKVLHAAKEKSQGLRLLLSIWGRSHGLGCVCLSPFHPGPVLQDILVCFLSDPLIPGPGILVASIPNVSQGSGSDFKKWGQRAIFCDQFLAPGTRVLGIQSPFGFHLSTVSFPWSGASQTQWATAGLYWQPCW